METAGWCRNNEAEISNTFDGSLLFGKVRIRHRSSKFFRDERTNNSACISLTTLCRTSSLTKSRAQVWNRLFPNRLMLRWQQTIYPTFSLWIRDILVGIIVKSVREEQGQDTKWRHAKLTVQEWDSQISLDSHKRYEQRPLLGRPRSQRLFSWFGQTPRARKRQT